MTSRISPWPRAALPVVAACLACSCSLIKINGKPLGGGDPPQASSADRRAENRGQNRHSPQASKTEDRVPAASAAAAPAAAVSSRSEPVAIPAAFSPNPITIAGAGASANRSVLDLHGDRRSSCTGYVTEDVSAVLELASPVDAGTLVAPHADLVFAKSGDEYRCDVAQTTSQIPSVSLKGWSGTVKVWVGRVHSGRRVNPLITVEDMARPRTVPWLEEGEPITLKAAPKKPRLVSVNMPALPKTPPGVIGCRGKRYRQSPDVALRITRSVVNLNIDVRSPGKASLMLMGPIPDDHRNIPARCYERGAALGRLEPGHYLIKIGTAGNKTPVSVVLRHDKAPRDPLLVARDVPADLDLPSRWVTHHFPMLEEDDIWQRDSVRQGLFARAPRGLFVFPKHDLTAETAGFVARVGTAADRRLPKHSPVSYPKQNEPLLAFRKGYVSADGNVFNIHRNDIALTPSGRVAMPKAPRNPGLSYAHSANSARTDGTAAEKAQLRTADAAFKRFTACDARIWKPANARLRAIEQGPYSEARQRRIHAIEQATREKSYRACKVPYNRVTDQVWGKLIRARTARRARALGALRKRLARLFARP